ncbi:amidohydrolase family protein [Chitinophaga sp. MM2321]|uniref:amidohydrolase family protein n=1 Tax=Chitinophaga sp. MM2321 TaxID=3137178 RepID=UPI0032D58060
MLIKKHKYLLCPLLLLICSCGGQTTNQETTADTATYYTTADYAAVRKIDAHVHIRTTDTTLVHIAREDNFRLLTIVVDEEPGMEAQEQFAIQQKTQFPQYVSFATTFSVDGWNNRDWSSKTIDKLKMSIDKGAIAVKIYKNIGMDLKDTKGHFVMIDNPRFDEVLDFLTKAEIPVIGHLGEPKDCWLPLDQMQMNSNRKYYTRHPEYHMFAHPDHPSYEEQMAARDHMLEKHPGLRFVGAHLGSLEWNTDTLAMHLDKLPNMAVDMAARISDLQFLAMKDWQKVHDFFIRYQDRLLYGTDRITDDSKPSAEAGKFIHEAWLRDWAFLATGDTLHSSSFEGKFTGLKLPKSVIDKIYRKNAEAWFKGLNIQ